MTQLPEPPALASWPINGTCVFSFLRHMPGKAEGEREPGLYFIVRHVGEEREPA